MLDRDHLFSKEPERWWNWQREKAAGRLGLELMPKFAPQPENFKNRFDKSAFAIRFGKVM